MNREAIAPPGAHGAPSPPALPPTLPLDPLARRPIRLPEATERFALAAMPPPATASPADDRPPRASIIVVTYDNLVFTRLCLTSVLANTAPPDFEVIVVDNGSTDGADSYLRELARRRRNVRVVRNDANRGFAPANNQALALARGDALVLLNNDTIVPPGWLAGLLKHLEDPAIGAVGPVTNRICNEAQIDVPYHTYGEFTDFADEYTRAHAGEVFDIRMLAMFCLAMRREVFARVGPLDERFAVGMLEDDDYAIRVRAAGYRVVCAEDVFVHHFGEASFGKLLPTGEYWQLYETNRRRFEEKWGRRWEPYQRRTSRRYLDLTGRIRELARVTVPPEATVAVVSKGDEALLELGGPRGWHFPQDEGGGYAGYHPADSAAAIAALEEARARGADYLLVPADARWWLDHYRDFARHLRRRYAVVADREDTCLIVALRGAPGSVPAGPARGDRRGHPEATRRAGDSIAAGPAARDRWSEG